MVKLIKQKIVTQIHTAENLAFKATRGCREYDNDQKQMR